VSTAKKKLSLFVAERGRGGVHLTRPEDKPSPGRDKKYRIDSTCKARKEERSLCLHERNCVPKRAGGKKEKKGNPEGEAVCAIPIGKKRGEKEKWFLLSSSGIS